jgi:membrane peptidoglycan carboxypeptidase
MQTVKNLFLTQERTISRKLQELFLAWHLDRVLTKDRILEIYMNIAELGPGIYGVAQASEHYFGKRASDLNLLESAYLASLLPSPKTRYRYFCDGKLTPNFQGMVHGLLKRMVNLNRVNYDRYLQAMSASIQFNDSERQSAPECSRQAAAPQDDEGPS